MNFEIKEVTAIPCIDGEYNEENRQPALLILEHLDNGETVKALVFGGYEVPTSNEGLNNLWKVLLPSEIDTDWETLETVRA